MPNPSEPNSSAPASSPPAHAAPHYYEQSSSSGMHMKLGDWIDREEKVPDLSRRAAINGILQNGTLGPDDPGGLVIEPHERYDTLVLEKNPTNLPAAFTSGLGALVVREPLAQMIEELDPSLHQMWPVRVLRSQRRRGVTSEPYEGDWFVLVVTERRDVMDPEHSAARPFSTDPSFYHLTTYKKDVALRADALPDDIHLWRDTKLVGGLFASGRFQTELRRRKLKFISGFKAKVSGKV